MTIRKRKYWYNLAPTRRVAVQVTWSRENKRTGQVRTFVRKHMDVTPKWLDRALGLGVGCNDRRFVVGVYSFPDGTFLIGDDNATLRTLLLLRIHLEQLIAYRKYTDGPTRTLEQVFAPAPHLAPNHPAHQPGHVTAFAP